jgi:hypothetical protein
MTTMTFNVNKIESHDALNETLRCTSESMFGGHIHSLTAPAVSPSIK